VTQNPKKPASRDLSDLKARLGLAKPEPAPPAAAQTPAAQPIGIAPPGVAQQPAAPAPEPRRDPFAPTPLQPAHAAYAPIVDAGPQIEIPEEKKSRSKWIFVFIGVALIPLVVGWSCGRIYNARLIFNKTIDDAKVIKDNIKPIVGINRKIAEALIKARARRPAKGKMEFDEALVSELQELVTQANLKETKLKQDQIFRTNYARMSDVVVQKLFAYYNNTVKLYEELQRFVDRAKRNKETILQYQNDATIERNYGVIFANDAGGYYIGQLVQVGPPKCPEDEERCRPDEVEGFPVRMSNSADWSFRPGKAKRISEIVVPIAPDEHWREVAAGRPGYLSYRQYLLDYAQLSALAGALARDEKELMQNLDKQAHRNKLFAPI
jgi:ribosomal protein S13